LESRFAAALRGIANAWVGLMHPLSRFVLSAVSLCLVPSLGFSGALTLDAAVKIAIERAPQLQAEAAAIEAAQSTAIAAGRLPDPELMIGATNVPIEGEAAWSLERDFMTMREVGVMQSFPSRSKRGSQRERASAAIEVAQARKQQSALEIARSTAEAWVAVYSEQIVLEKLQLLRPEVQLQADSARAALRSGKATTVDALAAEAAISEVDDEILQARRDLHAMRAELSQWIGDDSSRTLAHSPALDRLPVARDALLGSVHNHAPLLAFDAQLALARAEVEMAKAEKRPDWSAQLSYAKRGDAFEDMVSLQFRVGLPLFSGSRQDPLIAARYAEARQVEAEREAELRMHVAEVKSRIAAWDAARARIDLLERERLPLARQRSQAALAGFSSGRLPLTSLLDAHTAEIKLQRDHAELLRDLGSAWAYLRYQVVEELQP
jgi:cobalt-zinc-cadmium efflux system outer membrane protein